MVILLMTQFYLSEYFIKYAEQNIHLLNKDDLFVVKLHPNDDIELYNALLK